MEVQSSNVTLVMVTQVTSEHRDRCVHDSSRTHTYFMIGRMKGQLCTYTCLDSDATAVGH